MNFLKQKNLDPHTASFRDEIPHSIVPDQSEYEELIRPKSVRTARVRQQPYFQNSQKWLQQLSLQQTLHSTQREQNHTESSSKVLDSSIVQKARDMLVTSQYDSVGILRNSDLTEKRHSKQSVPVIHKQGWVESVPKLPTRTCSTNRKRGSFGDSQRNQAARVSQSLKKIRSLSGIQFQIPQSTTSQVQNVAKVSDQNAVSAVISNSQTNKPITKTQSKIKIQSKITNQELSQVNQSKLQPKQPKQKLQTNDLVKQTNEPKFSSKERPTSSQPTHRKSSIKTTLVEMLNQGPVLSHHNSSGENDPKNIKNYRILFNEVQSNPNYMQMTNQKSYLFKDQRAAVLITDHGLDGGSQFRHIIKEHERLRRIRAVQEKLLQEIKLKQTALGWLNFPDKPKMAPVVKWVATKTGYIKAPR